MTTSLILKKTKKTGNYSIFRKNTDSKIQQIKYKAYGIFLPHGKEEYNGCSIINGTISCKSNINYNLIVSLKKIINTFDILSQTSVGKNKYLIGDKAFFSFLKEIKEYTPTGDLLDEMVPDITADDLMNDIIPDQVDPDVVTPESNLSECEPFKEKKYQVRLYLKYGVKITHSKIVGEISADHLKKKVCNIDFELGSMWVNEETKKYGLNVYVTHIKVLR